MKKRSTVDQILNVIIEGVWVRNLQAVLWFVDFSTFDSIQKGKLEQIFFVYGIPKKVQLLSWCSIRIIKQRSLDGDTKFFNILAGVLKSDTLTPFLFIICLLQMLMT